MRINEVAFLYKNLFEEGTAKGSFFINNNGLMSPKTRNVTLWGLASSLSIPEEYRKISNIVTYLKDNLSTNTESPIPAFFKFQKAPYSIFMEAVAMEIATHFNTKTCFNFPASIDNSPNSLYRSVSPFINTNTERGNMVFSFLGRDEELFTFYKIANARETTTDVMTLTELVPQFIATNLPQLSNSQAIETIRTIQQDYAYQYLLRDLLGDIDFTSKNSGIVINKQLGYATLAPNFDYGEVMNLLISNKFDAPVLDSIDNYPESLRAIMTQERIDKANSAKLKMFNTPIREIAKQSTFLDKSDINIRFICSAFPEVAESFNQDLQEFLQSGLIPEIIDKYAEEGLVTPEQADMCVEYLQERGDLFNKKLEENLSSIPNELRYATQTSYEQNEDTLTICDTSSPQSIYIQYNTTTEKLPQADNLIQSYYNLNASLLEQDIPDPAQ